MISYLMPESASVMFAFETVEFFHNCAVGFVYEQNCDKSVCVVAILFVTIVLSIRYSTKCSLNYSMYRITFCQIDITFLFLQDQIKK